MSMFTEIPLGMSDDDVLTLWNRTIQEGANTRFLCNAVSPEFEYLCCRADGHDGYHVATGVNSVLGIWWTED